MSRITFRKIILTNLFLVMGSLLSYGHIASAASPATMYQTLSQIEVSLQKLQTLLSPEPQVAGAETIVVSNDDELGAAILRVTGGETIQLRPGTYGTLAITDTQYWKVVVNGKWIGKRSAVLTAPVTITSQDPNNRAILLGLELRTAPKWRFENLSFRPAASTGVAVALQGDDIVFTNNDITYGDTTGFTKDDWVQKVKNAINVNGGKNIQITYNHLKNIGFGISVNHKSPNVLVRGNVIESFRGDAFRALGDDGVYEHNLAFNPIQVDANHSDYFQSWRDYGNNNRPVEDVTVRYNTFLWQTEPHEFRANTQGIGLFDGPYKNWNIHNNLLAINHWHGITVGGGIDTTVKNNLVVDVNTSRPGPAWVRITPTKSKAPSVNSFSTDNIGNDLMYPYPGVTNSGNKNIKFAEYDQYFVDHTNNNWNVKPGAIPFTVGASDYKVFFKNGVPPSKPTPTPTPTPTPPPTTPPGAAPTPTPVPPTISPTPTPAPAPTPTTPPGAAPTSTTPAPTPTPIVVVMYLTADTPVYQSFTKPATAVQKKGAKGTYDPTASTRTFQGEQWTRVNFDSGRDGFVPVRLVTQSYVAPDPVVLPPPQASNMPTPVDTVTTNSKPVIATSNLNLRTAPAGTVQGVVTQGTKGTIDTTKNKQVVNGVEWIPITFADGRSGYVAASLIADASTTTPNREALLKQIEALQAQIKVLLERLKTTR